MKDIAERLDAILLEIEKLRAQESLLRDMISEANGKPKAKMQAPRSSVKQTVIDLLEVVGASGLNAGIALDMAEKSGIYLDRGTVSSLLSRLKNDGVIEYDGRVYRLIGAER